MQHDGVRTNEKGTELRRAKILVATAVASATAALTLVTGTAGPAAADTSVPFVAHRVRIGDTWTYAGTGEPGRHVTVGKPSCSVDASVGRDGRWAMPVACTLAPDDEVLATETATAGPSAGSRRGRLQFVTQPDVRLAAPDPGARVPLVVAVRVEADDLDDAARPSEVVLWVDGRVVASLTTAPFTFMVPLRPGSHRLAAWAFDTRRRTAANGVRIAARTAVRTVLVA